MNSKKVFFIIFLIILCLLFAVVGFFNYEKIEEYIYSEKWSYIYPLDDIKGISIIDITGNESIITASSKEINAYSKLGTHLNTTSAISNNYLMDSSGSYSVVIANDTNTIFLFKKDSLISSYNVNYEIKSVSVNKNGYVAIIFMQNGYKSGIKVFSPAGNEQLTTYLANTNATDCLITGDNKYLYISFVDMSGIKINSGIKIVDISKINSSQEESFEEFELGKDELVYDIVDMDNNIFISSTAGIYYFNKQNVVNKICSINSDNTLFTSIEGKYPVVVSKGKDSSILLKIYQLELHEAILDNVPQGIAVKGKRICLNMGDCIEIYNEKATLISKIDLSNKVIRMLVLDNGTKLAVVYRDKIEIYGI